MKRRVLLLGLSVLAFSGCSTYQAATVQDGVVQNPSVGWNGYTVRVPEGVQRLAGSADENVPSREEEIRKRYQEANERYAADYYTSFYEQLLFEDPDQTWFLSFISETYELPVGWGLLSSVEKEYILNRLINRKKVVINDTDAHSEQIELQGLRGWYISGNAKPYFNKDAEMVSYEGIFLIGRLKEVFWVEAFGSEPSRTVMKAKVFEMAESLQVHE